MNLIQERLSTGVESNRRPDIPVRQEIDNSPNPSIYHDLPSNLVLKLGECIAVGRSGIVFHVEPVGLPSSVPGATLPPLVAKIGRQYYSKWLLREAWFYEEMQSLQGVVVPWYYGIYSARIPVTSDQAFLPWLEGWKWRVLQNREADVESVLASYEDRDGKDDSDLGAIKDEQQTLVSCGKFRDEYTDFVKQFEDEHQAEKRTTVVTILILERLGGTYLPLADRNWPMGKPIPEDVRYEILDYHIEMCFI